MEDTEFKERMYSVKGMTKVCFALYITFILSRVVVFLFPPEASDELSYVYMSNISCVGIGVSSLTLTLVRGFDIKYPRKLLIYRLNRLHIISDILSVAVSIPTCMYEYDVFTIYMLICTFSAVRDIIYNVVLACTPTLCFRLFEADKVRLCCYTKKMYEQCFVAENGGK